MGRDEKRDSTLRSLFYSEIKQKCFDFTLISLKLKDLETAKQGLDQNLNFLVSNILIIKFFKVLVISILWG